MINFGAFENPRVGSYFVKNKGDNTIYKIERIESRGDGADDAAVTYRRYLGNRKFDQTQTVALGKIKDDYFKAEQPREMGPMG
jgi:hypothetical protein